jgi:hypothetical protein
MVVVDERYLIEELQRILGQLETEKAELEETKAGVLDAILYYKRKRYRKIRRVVQPENPLRVYQGFKLPAKLVAKLAKYAAKRSRTKTSVVEKALIAYMKKGS